MDSRPWGGGSASEPSVCTGVGAPVTGLKVKTVPPPWEDRRRWSGPPRLWGRCHGLSPFSCLRTAGFDFLAFLFQAHVGRSTQQRRGGGYCSQSASTCQGSASSGSCTPKRDRMTVCLVSTLWGQFFAWCVLGLGSVAGRNPAQQPPTLHLSPPLSQEGHLPVTFLCRSSSPLSLPSFLRLTLFSALSFGSNLQVVPVPLTLTAETQKLFPVLCPHHTHSVTSSPRAVRVGRGLPAPHHWPRPSQGPWVPFLSGHCPSFLLSALSTQHPFCSLRLVILFSAYFPYTQT